MIGVICFVVKYFPFEVGQKSALYKLRFNRRAVANSRGYANSYNFLYYVARYACNGYGKSACYVSVNKIARNNYYAAYNGANSRLYAFEFFKISGRNAVQ